MRTLKNCSRLFVIVNNLGLLGKSYTDEKLVRKVLRSLTKPWLSKISAIQEGHDIDTTHLKNEGNTKKKKKLALRAKKEEEETEPESEI